MNFFQKTQSSQTLKLFYFFLAFLMYAFFGLSFVIGKKTLQFVSPTFLTAQRMLLAALILFIVHKSLGKKWVSIKGVYKEILLLSLFNIYLVNVLEFWGLQYLSCYKTCYIYSLAPFVAAALSFVVLKEKLGFFKIIGLTLAFVGFAPLLIYKEFSEGVKWQVTLPEWALLGAMVSTVLGWIVMRKCVYQKKFPVLLANGYSMLIGGVLAWITSGIFEGFYPFPVTNWSGFLWGALGITLVNNLFGYNVYAFLTKKFTITLLTFIGFLTPLLTALLGWIFLKESVTLLFFISYSIVLIGFIFFSKEEMTSKVRSK